MSGAMRLRSLRRLTGMTTSGAPCWIDLFTSDPERSRTFYSELLGWGSASAGPEYGGYINFSLDGGKVAGAMHNDGSQGQPDTWTVYLAVDDADRVTAAAAAAGGQVHLPPMQVGPLGTMGMVADPSGAAVGLWQPADHTGFDKLAEPGAPAWFELHTVDYDAAVPFYRDVFGWDTRTMADEPTFRYTTLGEGETAAAGIMDATTYGGGESRWAVYFNVADADAATAKAVDLCATVVSGPDDTPYGRIVELTDPTGARFRLQQP